jgi:hypothetical protein
MVRHFITISAFTAKEVTDETNLRDGEAAVDPNLEE